MSQPLNCLILGASYGSLLASKIALAGHNVTMVCTAPGAKLVNAEGTRVRLPVKALGKAIELDSRNLSGGVRACTPGDCDPSDFDLAILAMQEPQYAEPAVKALMGRIASSRKPCLSIMNMPPLPFLRRIQGLTHAPLERCCNDASVWQGFEPGLMSLCSPDPQAFRPPEEGTNVLEVGLPTNFKATAFAEPKHTAMLRQLEADIAGVRLDGKDVPVKLRVFDSLFVPMAKWSMLLTGNYRCVQADGIRPICDAVHGDIDAAAQMYGWVDQLARQLGADAGDRVPFEKYAKAAESLLKPSSAARAIDSGAKQIERVDLLVQQIGAFFGLNNPLLNETVAIVDARLNLNRMEMPVSQVA